jgi:hypothetical protein
VALFESCNSAIPQHTWLDLDELSPGAPSRIQRAAPLLRTDISLPQDFA